MITLTGSLPLCPEHKEEVLIGRRRFVKPKNLATLRDEAMKSVMRETSQAEKNRVAMKYDLRSTKQLMAAVRKHLTFIGGGLSGEERVVEAFKERSFESKDVVQPVICKDEQPRFAKRHAHDAKADFDISKAKENDADSDDADDAQVTAQLTAETNSTSTRMQGRLMETLDGNEESAVLKRASNTGLRAAAEADAGLRTREEEERKQPITKRIEQVLNESTMPKDPYLHCAATATRSPLRHQFGKLAGHVVETLFITRLARAHRERALARGGEGAGPISPFFTGARAREARGAPIYLPSREVEDVLLDAGGHLPATTAAGRFAGAKVLQERWISDLAALKALQGPEVRPPEAAPLPPEDLSDKPDWDAVFPKLLLHRDFSRDADMEDALVGYMMHRTRDVSDAGWLAVPRRQPTFSADGQALGYTWGIVPGGEAGNWGARGGSALGSITSVTGGPSSSAQDEELLLCGVAGDTTGIDWEEALSAGIVGQGETSAGQHMLMFLNLELSVALAQDAQHEVMRLFAQMARLALDLQAPRVAVQLAECPLVLVLEGAGAGPFHPLQVPCRLLAMRAHLLSIAENVEWGGVEATVALDNDEFKAASRRRSNMTADVEQAQERVWGSTWHGGPAQKFEEEEEEDDEEEDYDPQPLPLRASRSGVVRNPWFRGNLSQEPGYVAGVSKRVAAANCEAAVKSVGLFWRGKHPLASLLADGIARLILLLPSGDLDPELDTWTSESYHVTPDNPLPPLPAILAGVCALSLVSLGLDHNVVRALGLAGLNSAAEAGASQSAPSAGALGEGLTGGGSSGGAEHAQLAVMRGEILSQAAGGLGVYGPQGGGVSSELLSGSYSTPLGAARHPRAAESMQLRSQATLLLYLRRVACALNAAKPTATLSSVRTKEDQWSYAGIRSVTRACERDLRAVVSLLLPSAQSARQGLAAHATTRSQLRRAAGGGGNNGGKVQKVGFGQASRMAAAVERASLVRKRQQRAVLAEFGRANARCGGFYLLRAVLARLYFLPQAGEAPRMVSISGDVLAEGDMPHTDQQALKVIPERLANVLSGRLAVPPAELRTMQQWHYSRPKTQLELLDLAAAFGEGALRARSVLLAASSAAVIAAVDLGPDAGALAAETSGGGPSLESTVPESKGTAMAPPSTTACRSDAADVAGTLLQLALIHEIKGDFRTTVAIFEQLIALAVASAIVNVDADKEDLQKEAGMASGFFLIFIHKFRVG